MKLVQGKFSLFDVREFAIWLAALPVSREIHVIQNHHTFTPSYSDFDGSNHIFLLERMEQAHLSRRFDEIAQQLTTFPDGTVGVGRPFDKAPAGIRGNNTVALCIENLGNFDTNRDEMTPAHRDAIIQVNALLCQRFGITPDIRTVVYHHWFDLKTGARTEGAGKTKSCPGTSFFGGNSTANAEAYFLPLIRKALHRF